MLVTSLIVELCKFTKRERERDDSFSSLQFSSLHFIVSFFFKAPAGGIGLEMGIPRT